MITVILNTTLHNEPCLYKTIERTQNTLLHLCGKQVYSGIWEEQFREMTHTHEAGIYLIVPVQQTTHTFVDCNMFCVISYSLHTLF